MSKADVLADIQSTIGTETYLSDWIEVTQEMIGGFADVTLDHQWIHIDPARAQADSPFGTTIAHGFLTLSLIPYLTGSVNPDKPRYPGVRMGLNYGLNRVRFPNPVRVGSKVRAHVVPMSVEEVRGDGLQIVNQVTIEIDGAEKPGCVAETVSRIYF